MKNIGLVILVILLLASCENNEKFKNSLDTPQISESDIKYFQNLVGDTILFTVDQSGLRPDAISILKAQADWLKEKKFLPITIEGHADEQGTREYNLALGERRAKAVADYLAIQGISRARIEVVSYGEERPVALRSNAEDYALNRRVELK